MNKKILVFSFLFTPLLFGCIQEVPQNNSVNLTFIQCEFYSSNNDYYTLSGREMKATTLRYYHGYFISDDEINQIKSRLQIIMPTDDSNYGNKDFRVTGYYSQKVPSEDRVALHQSYLYENATYYFAII